MSSYELGKIAYQNNQPLSSCHYRGQMRYEWERGWYDAEDEKLKQNIKEGSDEKSPKSPTSLC